MRSGSVRADRLILEEFEPRILYSAGAALLFQPDPAQSAGVDIVDASSVASTQASAFAETAAVTQRHEVAFVDSAVPDSARLIDDLRVDSSRTLEIILLDAGSDGVRQISLALAQRHDIDAVHIISHGTDGAVRLGATVLDQHGLAANAAAIRGWGAALSPDADLLIYGCDVAADGQGRAFVDALAWLTGADVAASTNVTGSAARGGDWNLEYTAGRVEPAAPFSATFMAAWEGTLANAPPVNTVPGAQTTNENCNLVFSTANGNLISISEADAGANPGEVTLTVTHGTLSLAGTTGLTFTAGDGTADATTTFRGTIANINNALNGLTYTPASNFSGTDTLIVTSVDSSVVSLNVDNALAGHYTFDNTGDLGNDSSPAGAHDGTVNGATSVNDPTHGNVLSFDGTDSVQVPGHFGNPTSVTLAAWVNLTTADTGGAEVISLGDSVALRLDDSGGTLLKGFMYDGSTWKPVTYSKTLAGAGWHHVAYTFDDANNVQKLYLDGVQVASIAESGSISYTRRADSTIGSYNNGSSSFDFVGKIDDARVYSRVLSAAEIATLASQLSLTDSDNVAVTINPSPVAGNDSYSVNEDSTLNVDWWDTGWQNRKKITFDNSSSVQNLTDFAVLVRLDSSDIDFSKIKAGGADIRFLDADGTALAYQIESWSDTPGAESATVWVKVPQIDAGSKSDSIWIYYNNPNAADAQHPTDVWDADYAGIWHLNQATGANAPDATAHGNTAMPNHNPTATMGEIGGALTFSSTSELDIAASPSLDLSTRSDWTISAWVKPTSYGGTSWPLIYSYGQFAASLGLTVKQGTDGLIENWINDTTLLQSTSAVTLNQWNYVAISRTAATTTFYLNGVAVGSGASTAITKSGQRSYMGNDGLFASDQFIGSIDEVRVSAGSGSTASRSAEWLKAEYLSQNGSFAFTSLGSEQSAPAAGGVLHNDSDPGGRLLTVNTTPVVNVSHGSLTLNADGTFRYTPDANFSGSDSFTYQVSNDRGATTTAVVTLTVNPVNDAPAGADKTVTALGDGGYVFTAGDFGFSDPNDAPANALASVKISTLPGAGTLTNDGVAVTAGQFIAVADINAGKLVFRPAADANGAGYASFTFQVRDDGGTANGGVDLDQSPNTITVDVTAVNDPPAGADKTVTALEDGAYTFTAADFGFTDPNDSPANALAAVKIASLPGAGTLTDNGVAVTAGQFIAVADINAGKLVFRPTANANGAGYASFTFQVRDDGGTANGGVDLDQSANTITVDVTGVNDAPAGADNTVTTPEDTDYVFTAADFGFTDPNDAPANALAAVKIVSLPGAGTLKNNGVAVTTGQFISAADITAGKLVFSPAANANGAGYASFTFQVRDDGGTANGGADSDAIARTMTLDVTALDDAPVNNVPAGQGATYETPLVFSAANGNRISVSDVDAGGSQLKVSLTATNGSISLSGTSGLTFSTGDGTSDATMTFTGTMADINAALDGLSFVPGAGFSGAASLSITTDDQGSSGGGGPLTDSDTVSIDVNPSTAPTASNDAFSVNEDGTLNVNPAANGVLGNDASPGGAPMTAVLVSGPAHAGAFTFNADGTFSYAPVANFTGSDTFTYKANNGSDSNTATVTITVNPVNDEPSGADKTVTALEDSGYTFTAADFGFTDANDSPANAFAGVTIATLPGAGSVTLSGAAVAANQFVSALDIAAGKLKFAPAPNATGAGYASFTFQVRDDGGTANGGVDLDPSANTITVDVIPVNHAPGGADKTVTTLEDNGYTFTAADFGFTDPNDSPANALASVKITTLPGAGMLTNDGVAVAAGQFIAVADIDAGKLVFTPSAHTNGASYASFTFQVRDDGGTANGGIDLDQSPNTITVNVTAANPSASNDAFSVDEDGILNVSDAASGVLTNDASRGGVPLTAVLVSGPAHAAAFTFNADGTFSYAPAANFHGTDTFTYKASNGAENSEAATVTITVNPTDDAPAGADETVVTTEDTGYAFTAADFGFSDPNDAPANALASVKITAAPGAGTLTNDGVAVTAGQFIAVADINAGKLVFRPAADANGAGYASFTFQVRDDGGTANGGVDLDQSPNTITVDVTAVNDAPSSADNTVTTPEDTDYVFTAADFGFTDANDAPANALAAVKITTVPGAGTLTNNGVAVTAGQFISAADINAGKLVFSPAPNTRGAGYASFTFQVQDDGGTANGGVDLDPSANTLTLNVMNDVPPQINDAPSGTDTAVTTLEDTRYVFTAADFGFTDPNDSPANALVSVKITTLPGAGTLVNNGLAVAAGQFIAVADINAGKLVFTPDANANGAGYASFTFQVRDDGGADNGGVDLDQSPNTITLNVTAVNDAPAGADKAVTALEDGGYVFRVADFGFTDPNDSPNALASVRIATLPGAGTLTNNGVAVTAGQFISVADINAGKLVFTPGANANGAGYASFTFQVRDDGGTANGGVDLDPTPNTITLNVTAVNDAPAGADQTVSTLEDSGYVFTAANFGFTDPDDSPANALASIRITSLPGAGTLTKDGVAVTAGQFIAVADINAGKLVFTPAADGNGAGYASFTFKVRDDGGTANGGADLDQTAHTITLDVTPVNDAPRGADKSVTTNERTDYVFTLADFGFSDPNDSPANAPARLKISTLPGAGILTLSGRPLTAGEFVSAANIAAGRLKFTAAGGGAVDASFTFQVQDDGGTAHGGVDLDPSARTLTVSVTAAPPVPSNVVPFEPALPVPGFVTERPGVVDGDRPARVPEPARPAATPDRYVPLRPSQKLFAPATGVERGPLAGLGHAQAGEPMRTSRELPAARRPIVGGSDDVQEPQRLEIFLDNAPKDAAAGAGPIRWMLQWTGLLGSALAGALVRRSMERLPVLAPGEAHPAWGGADDSEAERDEKAALALWDGRDTASRTERSS